MNWLVQLMGIQKWVISLHRVNIPTIQISWCVKLNFIFFIEISEKTHFLLSQNDAYQILLVGKGDWLRINVIFLNLLYNHLLYSHERLTTIEDLFSQLWQETNLNKILFYVRVFGIKKQWWFIFWIHASIILINIFGLLTELTVNERVYEEKFEFCILFWLYFGFDLPIYLLWYKRL
jgi:hypothetical protein